MSARSKSSDPLESFAKAIGLIRTLDSRAEVTSISLLLNVMKAHPKKVHQKDLTDILGLSAAALSRNVMMWTKNRHRDRRIESRSKGLGLISQVEDPDNRRAKLLSLTSKGVLVRDQLIDILK